MATQVANSMSMSLSSDSEVALRDRVAEHIQREVERDVDALFQFIDPAIRESRANRFAFEPARTISEIREYTSRIESAELLSFAIGGYTEDGGVARGNVPTAIVLSTVCYNNRETKNEYRTPWVLRDGRWYTCAVGKMSFPPEET